MKILLAGMHTTPNQFTRGIQNFGCHWVHWHGSSTREEMPTNCDAVVIAKCQISHAAFWKAKDAYLGMKKPMFISSHSFAEISSTLQQWLKDVGHLDDLGRVKRKEPEVIIKNTAMSHAFRQAAPILPKEEENPVPRPTIPNFDEVRPVINKMIQEEHAKEASWQAIANKLNQHNLPTPTGIQWSSATAPAYALKHGIVQRRINTAAGPAGSTGTPTYPKSKTETRMAASPATKQFKPSKKDRITDHEIEEIMTSNLNTQLKLRVIRLLALADL